MSPRPSSVTIRNVPAAFTWLIAIGSVLLFARYFYLIITNPIPPLLSIFDFKRFPDPGLAQRAVAWFRLAGISILGVFILAVLGIGGRRVRKWIGLSLEGEGPLVAFPLDFGFGILAFNTFWLGTGLLRLWHPCLWGTVGIFTSVLAARDFKYAKLDFVSRLSGSRPGLNRIGGAAFLLAGMGLFYTFVLWAHSLLPETFYDSLNYFLGMPHYWLFQHGISDDPTQILSGYFHGGSLYFLNGYLLSGTEGAKFLSVGAWLVCVLFAAAWMGKIAGIQAGFLAWGLLATFPLLYLNAWASRVDGLATLASLFFFYAFFRISREEGERTLFAWALAGGLFTGLALTVKPTSILGAGAAFLAAWFLRRDSGAARKKAFVLTAFWALLVVAPWFLKNWAFTGNPFYPYAIHWFPQGRQFPESGYLRLLGENRQYLQPTGGIGSFLQIPWTMLMSSPDGKAQFVGPLLAAFLPLVFLVKVQNETLKFLALTGLLLVVPGLGMSHMLRFLMPAFVIFFMGVAAVLSLPSFPLRKLGLVLSLLSSVFCFSFYCLDLSATVFDGTGVWAGKETRSGYLQRKLSNSYEGLAEWVDQNLPEDARLLLVGDARGVYYPRPFLANSVFDGQVLAEAARLEGEPEGIRRRLRRMGVTHVVVNVPEGIRTAPEYHHYDLSGVEWKRLNEFLRLDLEPVYFKGLQAVYRVREKPEEKPFPYVVNPFSFFSVPALDLSKAVQAGDLKEAQLQAEKVTALFPVESYWWEQKAVLHGRRGEDLKATECYREGDRLGRLTREGYRGWMESARRVKRPLEAIQAGERAKKFYPDFLGNT